MTYKDYESMGTDLWSLNADEMFKAAVAYRKEVSRRLAETKKTPGMKLTKAYKNLGRESATSSRELVLTRQGRGETTQQWRGRIMQEIARAKRYIANQTSTRAGYQAWRNNTLDALANAVGLTRKQLVRKLPGQTLERFLRYFEDVKQEVMTYYYRDSEETFKIVFEVFESPEWQKKSMADRIDYIKERIDEKWRQDDVGPGNGSYPTQTFSIGSN